MEQLLSYILESITGKSIPVAVSEEEGKVVFEISPDEETIGLIIGKGGKTIKAIQEVMRVRARKENIFIYIRVANHQEASD